MKLPFGLGKGDSDSSGDQRRRAEEVAAMHNGSRSGDAPTEAFPSAAGDRAQPQVIEAQRGRARRAETPGTPQATPEAAGPVAPQQNRAADTPSPESAIRSASPDVRERTAAAASASETPTGRHGAVPSALGGAEAGQVPRQETDRDDADTEGHMRDHDADTATTAFPAAGYSESHADNQTTAFERHDGYESQTAYSDRDYPGDESHTGDYVGAGAGAVGAGAAGAAAHHHGDDRVPERRGTTNFGRLILRVGVATMLLLHSLRIVFGMFNGPGIENYAQLLTAAGFGQANLLATIWGVAQLVASVMLLIGLATPLATAALISMVTLSAITLIGTAGSFTILGGSDLSGAPSGGLEIHILYLVALLAILFAGGGSWGLDFARRWSHAPKWSGILWLIAAIVVVAVVWYVLNGTNPLSGASV